MDGHGSAATQSATAGAPGQPAAAGLADLGPRLEPGKPDIETCFALGWHIAELYGLPEEDPRRTYVEYTLEPAGAGTRLTVVEYGFAQLPEDAHRQAYDGNTEGWAKELGELAAYLDAA